MHDRSRNSESRRPSDTISTDLIQWLLLSPLTASVNLQRHPVADNAILMSSTQTDPVSLLFNMISVRFSLANESMSVRIKIISLCRLQQQFTGQNNFP